MATVTKAPTKQESLANIRDGNGDLTESDWATVEKIESDDQVFASCTITAKSGLKSKPGKIIASNFGFKLKPNAKINSIKVIWAAHVRDGSNGTQKVPVIPGIKIAVAKGTDVIQ